MQTDDRAATLRWSILASRLLGRGRDRARIAISTLALWLARRHGRRVLAALDDHQLYDIGISRADALRESAKPFWKPWTARTRPTNAPFARPPLIAGSQPERAVARRVENGGKARARLP
jgi:uncharacterized protein YjiS (DUF1127 family)